MLDNIEQNDDIHMTDLPQALLISHALQHIQSGTATLLGGVGGQLDPHHLEMAPGLLEKKAIGASQLQQPAARAVAANEGNAACEFAPQYRLGSAIIGVAVGLAAGEIVRRVICRRVETR